MQILREAGRKRKEASSERQCKKSIRYRMIYLHICQAAIPSQKQTLMGKSAHSQKKFQKFSLFLLQNENPVV